MSWAFYGDEGIDYICFKENTMEQLNDKWLRLLGIPLSVAMLLLAEMPFFFPGRWDLLWKYMLISIICTGLIWEASRYILIRIRRLYPGLEHTTARVAWMLTGFAVVAGIGQFIMQVLIHEFDIAPAPVLTFRVWLINFSISMFFIVLIGGIYEAIYFFGHYKLALQRTELLKKEQARQHLEALKNRVNPHFLFNCLTTLSALIGEDARRAERFVDELSKVYRYLLRANRQLQVPLADELAFSESYTYLLITRLGAAFDVHTKVDAQYLEQKLPPLILQNLLDYLIRTQTISPEKPLLVDISANENALVLTAPYQPKTVWVDSGNLDWAAIASAYEQQSGRQAVQAVVDNRLHFRLPFMQEIEAAA